MKRVFTFVTVIAAAALLNGCTKCSGDRPADAPAPEAPAQTPPADQAAPPADAGAAAPGSEGATGTETPDAGAAGTTETK